MLNRILTLSMILILFSCGKDVVEIVDTPIPPKPNEIFEVNIVGFVTDQDRNVVEQADLTFDGEAQSSNATSLFEIGNAFVSNMGGVIKAEKEGYLPTYKRIYNHRTTEDVIVNIPLVNAPNSQQMSAAGGSLESEDGAMLNFGPNTITQNNDVTFYSSTGSANAVDIDLFISNEDSHELLDAEALFYVDFVGEIATSSNLSLELDSDKIIDLENGNVYWYDESSESWEKQDEINVVSDKVNANITKKGWWAIGRSVPSVYGSVKFNQPNGSSTGISPLVNTEVVFSNQEGNRIINEHLFTSNEGLIYKYFPIETVQEAILDNGSLVTALGEFSTAKIDAVVEIQEQLLYKVDGGSFSCALDDHSGYVASIFDNQFVIERVADGDFEIYVNLNDEYIDFEFYDADENIITSNKVNSDQIGEEKIRFVACDPTMEIEDYNSVLQSLDKCRVRVKPIESFIVGENDSDEKIFVAFQGNETGIYEGLVFVESIPSLGASEIEKEVTVEILIYDLISETIAGTVDGKYTTGEEYKVTFIGNVEK